MGFLDRLFGGKESKEDRFVKRNVERLLSKYGQRETREEAMHTLAQHGTPESIHGLLQRFTYNHPESIVDENEKHKVVGLLEVLGAEACEAPLLRYLEEPRQTEISMALIALERLLGPERACQEIIRLLEQSDPGDHWSSDRKLQLINHLDNYDDKTCIPVLIRFLEDINDDVVFRCIDILERIASDDEFREPITLLLTHETTSARIASRLLDLVRNRKWFIGGHRNEIEPHLPEGYYFDKRDNIKKREGGY